MTVRWSEYDNTCICVWLLALGGVRRVRRIVYCLLFVFVSYRSLKLDFGIKNSSINGLFVSICLSHCILNLQSPSTIPKTIGLWFLLIFLVDIFLVFFTLCSVFALCPRNRHQLFFLCDLPSDLTSPSSHSVKKNLEFFYDKLNKHVTFLKEKVYFSIVIFILWYALDNIQYTRVHSTSSLSSFIPVTQFCSSALRTDLYYLFITLLPYAYAYVYVFDNGLIANVTETDLY